EAPGLALHDFQEAIRLDPKNGDAFNGRGYAQAKLKQYGPAVTDTEKALMLGPPTDSRTAYVAARTYALAAAGRQDSARVRDMYEDRALELLRLALERKPTQERARFWQDPVLKDNALEGLHGKVEFDRLTKRFLAGKVRGAASSSSQK